MELLVPPPPGSAPAPLEVSVALVEHARARPDDIALTVDDTSITYGEAYARASALATAVVERSAAGDVSPVPVIGTKHVEALVGLMAVVLTGRPVTALDALDAPERLRGVVGRLGARVALAPKGFELGDDGLTTIAYDGDDATRAVDPFAPVPLASDQLAAMVFTSGSTGEPKGVMYDAWLVDTVNRYRHLALGFDPTELLASAGPFPVSLTTSLVAMSGSRAVTRSEVEPEGFFRWVEDWQFEFMAITPSLALAALRLWPGGRPLPAVRTVATYGEGITWADLGAIRAAVGDHVEVRVQYGATEAPLSGAVFVVPPEMPLGEGPVPLGHPSPGAGLELERVPVGPQPGAPPPQLVITGPVACGYWGDPERTAERFTVSPEGVRSWRSGDLGELGADGLFRHRGRVDDLVKVNGRLVEPAEPERVLRSLPGVHNAAVLAVPGPTGKARLVAHVEADPSAGLGPDELRAALVDRLPPFLVPTVFVPHDDLPLTDRRKVDRRALAAMELAPWTRAPARPAADDAERAVLGVVRDVTGIDDVGPDDDLWALGCDSLAALEIASALGSEGDDRLVLTDLIEHRTPAALARRLRTRSGGDHDPIVVFNDAGSRPPLFLVPGAGATAVQFMALAERLGPDQPVIVLEPPGLHGDSPPPATIDEAATVAMALLDRARRGRAGDAVWLGGFSWGGVVAQEMAVRLGERGVDVRLVLFDSAAHPQAPWWSRLATLAGKARSPRSLLRGARARATGLARRVGPSALVGDGGAASGRALSSYDAYFEAGYDTSVRHRPRPLAAPTLVLETAGTASGDSWRPFVADLEVRPVGGTHNDMLYPPHVDEIVAALTR